MNGTWTPEPVWWGLKEGLLELAPIADFVPDDVKDLVEGKKAEIVSLADFESLRWFVRAFLAIRWA
jgi:basic membrane lipoprotein Med (substrate-binding protein (PBP1-ABC) superfamily)